MLSKIANHLLSGFEKKACDPTDLPKHHQTELHAYIFETIPESLTYEYVLILSKRLPST